jgi:hypothetical protein
LSNIEINIPQTLEMKEVIDTEVNILTKKEDLSSIAKV